MSQIIHIATRKSMLALWQAETIQKLLISQGVQTKLLPIVTTGDKMQKSQLAEIQLQNENQDSHHLTTGKGLFIKEIQEALLSKKAHIAVHSMKDLPVTQTKGLNVVSLLPRAGARDILILSPDVLQETKLNLLTDSERKNIDFEKLKSILLSSKLFMEKQIGTTSTRRQMLLKKIFSNQLNLQILRGNVDSRLKRVKNNEFSAIILAEAGLERLGFLNHENMFFLPTEKFVPATAQGVIALEAIENDLELISYLNKLNCKKTCIAAGLERMVLALLGGDCHSSIGVYYENKNLHIICGRNLVHKEAIIKIESSSLNEIESLFLESKGNFSIFFTNLCHSIHAKNINEILIEKGFLEVSELNFFNL